MQSDPERRARGAQKLGEILGQTPDQVDRSLGDVAPQLATYVLETIYGEIYQSETLDSRTRQIVTVAALATLGTAAPQLRTHIGGALRCGVTREELVGIMMQLGSYVGVAGRSRAYITGHRAPLGRLRGVGQVLSTGSVNHHGSEPEWSGIRRSVTVLRKF